MSWPKRCAGCKQTYSKEEWGPSNGYCRSCQRDYMRAWRARNPELMAEYRRRREAKHGTHKKPKDPAQRRAQWAVSYALEKGRLVRPLCCPQCGRKVRVDAHHEDYSKPLEVEWLCRRCHMTRHADEELTARAY